MPSKICYRAQKFQETCKKLRMMFVTLKVDS